MNNFSLHNKTFRKILIIQTAFLGDVILSTTLPKALKTLYPEAQIDLLLIPETKQVYDDNPYVTNIHTFAKRRIHSKIATFLPLSKTLRKERYDLVISLQKHLTTSLLMLFAGIPVRIGSRKQKLITHSIVVNKDLPVFRRYLSYLKLLSDKSFEVQTELFWDEATQNKASTILTPFLNDCKYAVGIAPGSVWSTKRWLPEYFAELITSLNERNIRSVLLGGKEDAMLCQDIINMSGIDCLNLAGKLTIKGSAAVINKLDLIVSNDSAPLHIANAVKTDVAAIFGPTIKSFGFAPYRENDVVVETYLPCRPCGKHGGNNCPLKHFKCMKDLKPSLVLKAIDDILTS
jgi:heptosyltransferase II